MADRIAPVERHGIMSPDSGHKLRIPRDNAPVPRIGAMVRVKAIAGSIVRSVWQTAKNLFVTWLDDDKRQFATMAILAGLILLTSYVDGQITATWLTNMLSAFAIGTWLGLRLGFRQSRIAWRFVNEYREKYLNALEFIYVVTDGTENDPFGGDEPDDGIRIDLGDGD